MSRQKIQPQRDPGRRKRRDAIVRKKMPFALKCAESHCRNQQSVKNYVIKNTLSFASKHHAIRVTCSL